MSKSFGATGGMTKSKSWADVGDDDFFAEIAQDKPASKQASPTSAFGTRPPADKPEKKAGKAGGVPWAFPNPVPQQQSAAAAPGSRFDSLSPNQRRSAPLDQWRR